MKINRFLFLLLSCQNTLFQVGVEVGVGVEEVQAKVRRVLSDPSFTTNAVRISQKMQVYEAASEAARLIESLGHRGQAQTSS